MQIRRLGRTFAAEILGLDLSRNLSKDECVAIQVAWMRYGVLVFRRQEMTPSQLIAFTHRFGEPVVYTRSENAHPEYPEVLVLSNVVEGGLSVAAAGSSRYWHTDGHFLAEPPAGTVLFAREVPPRGGDTWFVDATAAHDSLPIELQRQLEGARVVIDRVQTLPYHYPERVPPEQPWPTVSHPLVRTHPVTGRKALYVGGIVPWRIEQMPVEESAPLMRRLRDALFQERFMYVHRWQVGDALLWDNRCTAHRATNYDMQHERRMMLRTTIAGDVPF